MTYFAIITLYLATVLANAPVAENPRARLDFLVGEWTIEGREQTFNESCVWFHDRSHVVCSSENRGESGVRKGVSVFSYSDAGRRFLYHHYGSSGAIVSMDVFVGDRMLIATRETREDGDQVREQVWMTPDPDGTYEFREETSKNGGPWTTTTRVRYVRRSSAGPAAGEVR